MSATTPLDAASTNLEDYLNEPVHDIMGRFGLLPTGVAPASQPASAPSPSPSPAQTSQSQGAGSPDSGGGGLDPSQMIQPVTDALGRLGSGQMGQPDPTQSYDGIGQALDSAGSQVQQALSSLGDDWQGDASSAAQATAKSALADGTKVADQAAALRTSLATAASAVQTAQTRLVEIVDEFWAKIAAIGPNIIFPWGIAAAIEAATQAVTETGEVMADTESTLAAQAAVVSSAGAPVDVTSAPALGAAGQALNPLMQLASSVTAPVMQAVGSASNSAPGSGDPAGARPVSVAAADHDAVEPSGGAAGGFGGGPAAASAAAAPAARALAAAVPAAPAAASAVHAASARPVAPGSTGAPMGGGAPMGHQGRAGLAGDHSAADFLHTSDQGGEIVGDLGTVAPPVIGEKDPLDSPAGGLRIG